MACSALPVEAASAWGCFGLLRLHPADGTENGSDCQRPGNWISHGWTSSRVHFGLAAKCVMRPEFSLSGACLVLPHQTRCSELLFKDMKNDRNTKKLLLARLLLVLLHVFEKIVNDIQNGTATCSSRKKTQLTWCLAEALKAMDQVVLAKCEAISLFRDERHGRIAIRFRAVTKDLHVLSGFLGQEQFAGTGGRALTFATEHVMKRACSRFSGRHDSKQTSFLKKSLFQHFKSKLVSVTTDSAADEVLSSELMRTEMTGFREVLAPNLRWVARDKAHGSRRITSRPWHSDEFLNEVLQFMAGGHASIARLVHYSPEIKRIFQQFANTSESTVFENCFELQSCSAPV